MFAIVIAIVLFQVRFNFQTLEQIKYIPPNKTIYQLTNNKLDYTGINSSSHIQETKRYYV